MYGELELAQLVANVYLIQLIKDRVCCPCFVLCGLVSHLCVLYFLVCRTLSWVLAHTGLGYQRKKKNLCNIWDV